MESRLVPPRGFAFEAIHFSGVRGKGLVTLALLPVRLLRACWQSLQVLARVRPDVVLGFGGYISLPGGLMALRAVDAEELATARHVGTGVVVLLGRGDSGPGG
jgi:UDP-N-acetylglucosamine--N-acetylmuramyl-(pentapeptide) pyrophosphoryl-undecaprenol N-acetylglucosamine transferase